MLIGCAARGISDFCPKLRISTPCTFRWHLVQLENDIREVYTGPSRCKQCQTALGLRPSLSAMSFCRSPASYIADHTGSLIVAAAGNAASAVAAPRNATRRPIWTCDDTATTTAGRPPTAGCRQSASLIERCSRRRRGGRRRQ
jgi:hypothetical protein